MDTSTLVDEEFEIVDEPESEAMDAESGDTEETAQEADEIRKGAARKITSQGKQLRKTDLALVDLIAETPEKAPELIDRIKDENPELAQRLSRMFQRRELSGISEKFKDPQVQSAFEQLAQKVDDLTKQTETQRQTSDKKTYKQWRATASELDDADLRASFKSVLDTYFSASDVTDELLDDALAIAKRRIGWQEQPVKVAARKIATEQAIRARSYAAPRGGTGISPNAPIQADPDLAQRFGNNDPERLKKVAEAKAKARF